MRIELETKSLDGPTVTYWVDGDIRVICTPADLDQLFNVLAAKWRIPNLSDVNQVASLCLHVSAVTCRGGRNYILVWWPGAESNCRHADFQ